MADWATILAGGLGGAAQGYGQVQNQRNQDIRRQLQEKQVAMQQEEAKRAAVMEAYKTLQPGQEVDPVQASTYKAQGLGGLEAREGKIYRAKSPQDELNELKLGEYEEESKVRSRQRAVLEEVHNDGSGFFLADLPTRLSKALAGGLKPEEVMTPEERMQFAPSVETARINDASRINAAKIAASGKGDPLGQQKLNVQIKTAAARQAEAVSKDVLGQIDPIKYKEAYNQAVAELTGRTPTVGGSTGGSAQQVGKYKVEY